MGRVCYHPCESVCNRAELDQAVGINAVERFIGDLGIEEGWQFPRPLPPTRKRVLVVGAGPSGLSAAYHLARLGHSVTIRDAGPKAGGMMRYGIPQYRLPRDVLDAELERLFALGIAFEPETKVRRASAPLEDERFDAVFLAIGANVGRRATIPAGDAARVLDAVSVLRSMPRDADRQALHGTRVARSDLKRGDLVFFADSTGRIHHVGIYAGGGMMVESPRTGEAIRLSPLRSGYAGARRYL